MPCPAAPGARPQTAAGRPLRRAAGALALGALARALGPLPGPRGRALAFPYLPKHPNATRRPQTSPCALRVPEQARGRLRAGLGRGGPVGSQACGAPWPRRGGGGLAAAALPSGEPEGGSAQSGGPLEPGGAAAQGGDAPEPRRQGRGAGRAPERAPWDLWADQREPGAVANVGSFQIRRPLAAVPFLLLGVCFDLGGSMRLLLSSLPDLARGYRLDSIYPVVAPGGNPLACAASPAACQKRYYGGPPFRCTFAYPGDWSQDPSVELARMRQSDDMLTLRSGRAPRGSKPLPLVAVGPAQGAGTGGLSVSLYARRTRAASLAEALGTPAEALASLMGRFTEQAPKLRGRGPLSESVAAQEVAGAGDPAYRLESRVRYPGDAEAEALSVWTVALFSPDAEGGHVLLLTGVAPVQAPPEAREAVRESTWSLARLGG
ncbi:unnamed protein product [Prorocentrum cordatum]|uniref:Uncharacterized protein n=1 Tax=Prorocentrum cordatum TaxID=2364126 RepID=A0ABN9TKF3_9DINO|nr:unnamed protein product [Polarella glacialis]